MLCCVDCSQFTYILYLTSSKANQTKTSLLCAHARPHDADSYQPTSSFKFPGWRSHESHEISWKGMPSSYGQNKMGQQVHSKEGCHLDENARQQKTVHKKTCTSIVQVWWCSTRNCEGISSQLWVLQYCNTRLDCFFWKKNHWTSIILLLPKLHTHTCSYVYNYMYI